MQKSALNKYKTMLIEIRNRLSGEVSRLIEAVPEKAGAAGDLSHVPTHNADRESEDIDNEMSLIHNEEAILADVQGALERIEDGEYGACTECGGKIAEARLEALPYTPYCIDCATKVAPVW
ncbi:MAG TPA: TraR/DksA family transcriptional regulator [Pirellulales bacterium]